MLDNWPLSSPRSFRALLSTSTFAEQPARLVLKDRPLLQEWARSYKRGFALQAPLAATGFRFGALAWWQTADWLWLLGAFVLVANWPYTLIGIMPANCRLMTLRLDEANAASTVLIAQWGALHAIRTALGVSATAIFPLGVVRTGENLKNQGK